MKVVFLDFDGPIIPIMSHQNRKGVREKGWPPCIAALNRITDTTGAKIVVSSTWRLGGRGDCEQHLVNWGVTGEVIDTTPRYLEEEWKGERRILMAVPRGREIAAWLKENPVESFVIIDDDKDMEHLMPWLIHTPFDTGLTEADADKAIEMLAGSPERNRR